MSESTRGVDCCWHCSLNSDGCWCVSECVVGDDRDSLGLHEDADIAGKFSLCTDDDIMEFGVGGEAVGTVLV